MTFFAVGERVYMGDFLVTVAERTFVAYPKRDWFYRLRFDDGSESFVYHSQRKIVLPAVYALRHDSLQLGFSL